MGTSSKQEELKSLNDVQSSLRSYPVFFSNVVFFICNNRYWTGTKHLFVMWSSSWRWQIWLIYIRVNCQCAYDGVLSREHSEESEDLAALQALMSPAAYNTWYIASLSHRETRWWDNHVSWAEICSRFFLFNSSAWWVMSWRVFQTFLGL